MTHTYAILEISRACYDEISDKLKTAGYSHAFGTHDDDGRKTEVIDMHGIGLRAEPAKRTLTADVLSFVKKHPGRTAWGVAKELRAPSASVSSILHRLAEKGTLRRAKGHARSWIYYDPRFGHDY